MRSPFQQPDEASRTLARSQIDAARFAALAFVAPNTDGPMVTRIAFGTAPNGAPISLISDLAQHTAALLRNPNCSLLIGEPGPKGDPLTHPRLTIMATTQFISRESDAFPELADHYLRIHPKAKLYLNFADFQFVRFAIKSAFLNGGFGKAYNLGPNDFGL